MHDSLPCCRVRSATLANPNPRHAMIEARHRIVLCVDDDPVVLHLQRLLLEAAGFAVLTAGNSALALRIFVSRRPDAVILDHALPGMNGSRVAAIMRRLCNKIPLILNSGSAGIPAEDALLFDQILVKGTAAQSLTEVLRETLSSRATLEADPTPKAELPI